jgi:hypothetical protein
MIFIRPKISVKPAVKRKRSMAQDNPLNNWRKINCTVLSLQIVVISDPVLTRRGPRTTSSRSPFRIEFGH